MSKPILFTLAFVIGLLSSTAFGNNIQLQARLPVLSTCGVDEIQTPSGCWSSCSSSKYNACGDFYPLLYNPSYCAYTEDGRYISYTYECQACKSTGIVAVTSGACDCSFVKCGQGQQCQNGQCVDMVTIMPVDLCLSVTCPVGSECQNGECISLNKPCTKLCVIGSTCVNGECVPDTTVVAPIDRCALMRCVQGFYCQNGKCIRQLDLCSRILCAPGSICQNGRCIQQVIDLCATVKCSAGFMCRGGQCVVDPQKQICQARRLPCAYPRPTETTCPTRYYFVAPTPNFCGINSFGQQVNFAQECDACKDTSIQYYWNKPCDQISPCLSTKPIISLPSVDPCANIFCIATTTCIGGVCVPLAGNLLRV